MGTKKFLGAVAICFAVVGYASTATAAPVLCSSGPGVDLTQGCLVAGGPGNNQQDSEPAVEAAIYDALGSLVDLTLYGKSDDDASLFTLTPSADGKTGTWMVKDGTEIAYISIKAANSFLVFDVENVATGSWDTFGILNNGGNQPAMSHISFWTVPDEPSTVPEPATVALLGLGLAGLGIARRRARKA